MKKETRKKEETKIKIVFKEAEVCEYEKQIDQLVYKLYGLTS